MRRHQSDTKDLILRLTTYERFERFGVYPVDARLSSITFLLLIYGFWLARFGRLC